MPKLKNITAQEVSDLLSRAFDMNQDLSVTASRAEQGYIDTIDRPAEALSALLSLSRSALDLAAFFSMKVGLAELQATTRSELQANEVSGS